MKRQSLKVTRKQIETSIDSNVDAICALLNDPRTQRQNGKLHRKTQETVKQAEGVVMGLRAVLQALNGDDSYLKLFTAIQKN